MAIIETVTASSFIDAFRRMDRMDGWTYDGLRALYDYLDGLSDDTGEPIALDVIALCCDYSEYESATACIKDNGYSFDVTECNDYDPEWGDDEREDAAMEWLRDQTLVIEFSGGIIIQAF